MTEIWLVRHAQTDWNVARRYQGHSDIPLNETGWQQARELAGTIQAVNKPFQAVFSSPLSRAMQTAGVVAQCLRLPLHAEPRIKEGNMGDWEGMLADDIHQHYPDLLEARKLDPLNVPPPGKKAESIAAIAKRAGHALNDITSLHPNQAVLVVTHGLVIATLTCLNRKIAFEEIFQHIPHNAQPVVLDWHPDWQTALN
jgi:broad specificity phosphatase PhoE